MVVKKFLNEEPFQFRAQHGTLFASDRCDLRGWVRVHRAPSDRARAAEDVAQFAAHHAISIWPHLNGFQGYDCIHFKFED